MKESENYRAWGIMEFMEDLELNEIIMPYMPEDVVLPNITALVEGFDSAKELLKIFSARLIAIEDYKKNKQINEADNLMEILMADARLYLKRIGITQVGEIQL